VVTITDTSVAADRVLARHSTADFVGAGVGVVLIGVGLTLFALGPDPGRYDRPESETLSLRSLLPIVTVGQNSAGLSLAGRF
jgi:hypothetical protein